MSIPLDIDQDIDLLGQINKVENSTHCVGSWAGVSPGASCHRSIHRHSGQFYAWSRFCDSIT